MAEDHVHSPIEYQLMEEELTSSTERIYIFTASPLPSRIRSVEVKHSSLLADLSSVYCSSRTINIILILVFVFVTSLTVSIAVYKIIDITGPGSRLQIHLKSIHAPDVNSSEEPQQLVMTTERENSTVNLESNTTEINILKTRHCSQTCQLYSDKKFLSDCAFGRCVCRGENYQFLTCLLVDIKGESTETVILVLANYYPIIWKVRNHGVHVEKIILASQSIVGSSDVEIVPNTQETGENSKAKPKITAMQIPVGFGNDIHESKTVEMIKRLSERIGTVRIFAGVDYVDYISLRIHTQS